MIPIQNIYYMLSYAFKVLNEQGYKNMAVEKFDNTAELMAAILSKGIATQIKRGLGKEYILETGELSSLWGEDVYYRVYKDTDNAKKTNDMYL